MSLNILDLFGIKGRVAVVTGGSSGIGLMVAKVIPSLSDTPDQAKVALPTDPIDETVSELNLLGSASSGGSAQGYACDLSSKSAIAELASYISKAEGGKLDILISNAGIRRDRRSSVIVNTTAHYFLCVALLPLLAAAADQEIDGGRSRGAEQGRGVMVITSSCASMHNATNVDLTSYASSKAATDHLVKLLAAKFPRYSRQIVPSRMNPVGAEVSMFAGLFDKLPAKRAGREEDLAGTLLYLVSKAGAYVNGISLCVDGGRVLVANGQE
ncbi:short-chain dehydrogenase [Aspergillus tetrazonus]